MDPDGRWIDELFAAIDRKDHAAFSGFLLSDACFRFGNQSPLIGRTPISASVSAFFDVLSSIRHQVENRWVVPEAAIVTGTVTYTRRDGSTLTVPFATVMRVTTEGISDYRIFADTSALFPA